MLFSLGSSTYLCFPVLWIVVKSQPVLLKVVWPFIQGMWHKSFSSLWTGNTKYYSSHSHQRGCAWYIKGTMFFNIKVWRYSLPLSNRMTTKFGAITWPHDQTTWLVNFLVKPPADESNENADPRSYDNCYLTQNNQWYFINPPQTLFTCHSLCLLIPWYSLSVTMRLLASPNFLSFLVTSSHYVWMNKVNQHISTYLSCNLLFIVVLHGNINHVCGWHGAHSN